MNNQNKQININFERFLNKINAYVFRFIDKSITGKLLSYDGNCLIIELRSGSLMVADIDSLVSIWNVREKQELF